MASSAMAARTGYGEVRALTRELLRGRPRPIPLRDAGHRGEQAPAHDPRVRVAMRLGARDALDDEPLVRAPARRQQTPALLGELADVTVIDRHPPRVAHDV